MSALKIGSLFSGFGGLDMAVEEVFDATTAWVSDIDKGACKILAHRYPGVPNLGDITAIDWASVEPIDILTGGYPCQPFSLSGDRKGTDDERHLWPYVREAIRHLRPRITVLENVAGHRSMGFDRVLGDLAEDGLGAQWTSVLASDVGTPHRRERLFIVVTADTESLRSQPSRAYIDGALGTDWLGRSSQRALLPTPRTSDTNGAGTHGDGGLDLRTAVTHLPTPRATRGGSSTETVALLPTPAAADVQGGRKSRSGNRSNELLLNGLAAAQKFGQYAEAIARWEAVIGRPAPSPTEWTGKATPRLSPRFCEWMMGCPEGWITDVPSITRTEALKALGNGVVKQQAVAALLLMLTVERVA